MLTFELVAVADGFYHYDIYPEGVADDRQTIIFNPVSKAVRKNTFDESNRKYLSHFLQAVKDDDGNYRQKGMTAWG